MESSKVVDVTLRDILDDTHNSCRNAVEHVGAANYADREREAMSWVLKAFLRLEKRLGVVKDVR